MRLVVPVIVNEEEIIEQADLGLKSISARTLLHTFCKVDAILPHEHFLDSSLILIDNRYYPVALPYEELDKRLRKAELGLISN